MIDTIEFARLLADERRQQILRLCCCRWLSVNEIVAVLGEVSQPTVSHHLAVLRAAGLVKTRRQGKQVYYTLNQEQMIHGCCTLAENFAPAHKITAVPIEEK